MRQLKYQRNKCIKRVNPIEAGKWRIDRSDLESSFSGNKQVLAVRYTRGMSKLYQQSSGTLLSYRV